jgi:hypothetical protein
VQTFRECYAPSHDAIPARRSVSKICPIDAIRVFSARTAKEEKLMPTVLSPLDEQTIRSKAYELWCTKGYPEGTAEQDWYEALQLLSRAPAKSAAKTAPPAALPKAKTAKANKTR